MVHSEAIIVLDFGSQYTQLIARRVRELGVYSEIKPYYIQVDELKALRPKGIILSGGPSSVYAEKAPLPHVDIFELGCPVLGICYGLQVIAHLFDGKVGKAQHREYGRAYIRVDDSADLFRDLDTQLEVWMSHGDFLTVIPHGFKAIAHTVNAPIAAIKNAKRQIYGIQFHPEVVHTPSGREILKNFAFEICRCTADWSPEAFGETTVQELRQKIGHKKVLCALSGGVDSTVAAYLVARAIGHQLTCVFVDTGLLRQDEAAQVCDFYAQAAFDFCFVDASKRFLTKLQGIVDPEKKRKIIGEEFIRIFEEQASQIGDIDYLVQGTLYPDVIESVSVRGPSATIKSHHNVGGLPDKMGLELIEPLRELFKDEVRRVGAEIGVPPLILERHPFPGPGLAVRILGDVTAERLDILRPADKIFIEELHKHSLYHHIWQAFAVLLPVQTVGVMGDERTYENVVALRAVTSMDGMTADWAIIPNDVLAHISNRIINEIKGVNRVVYDISSKPPGTIEWE
ncbi:glutamine-hydrolyzing GMP synthase [candidate division KSB1 bacterium]|nr:glutamine-hydrolyzing GMP synthase [candidate division KSB1 bacterium]RQW01158.1 MAG: glutamine-hydrolyzing GMP synthase [candidate division KSB1 bacterium]